MKGKGSSEKKSGSRFFRGEDGMRHAEKVKEQQDKQRAESGNRVFRFFVPAGESKEIVILDEKPDFFMWEHNYKENGKWGNFASCCKEWETCPACDKYPDNHSYFGMYLTVIDLSEYTDKQGNEVEFSRKLLLVKPSQQKKITRLYERHKTLRGMHLEMTRDGEKDSAIGNDIEFLDFLSEDDLAEYVREWTDREGKTHEEDCSVPYEYETMFSEPTPENIAKQIGEEYEPSPGSAKANRKALDEEEDEDLEDEDEDEAPARRRKTAKAGKKAGATRRRAVDEDEDEEDEEEDVPWDEEEDEEEEKPAPMKPSAKKRRPLRKR
jgi:hypothetical protein